MLHIINIGMRDERREMREKVYYNNITISPPLKSGSNEEKLYRISAMIANGASVNFEASKFLCLHKIHEKKNENDFQINTQKKC